MNETLSKQTSGFKFKQMILWLAAMLIGGALGVVNCAEINDFFNFVAQGYTNLFKFVAIPTIALAITTTLASLGGSSNTGRIFLHTIIFTLLTTVAAALVGVLLYKIVAPGSLPNELISNGVSAAQGEIRNTNIYKHILEVIPDNILRPFFSGNVLSIVLVAAATGLALAYKKDSENIQLLL